MVVVVNCIVAGKLDKELSYECQQYIEPGTILEVPLRGKSTFALATGMSSEGSCDFKLKSIIKETHYRYKPSFINFLKKSASYTIQEVGLFFKSSLFMPTTEKQKIECYPYPSANNIELSPIQEGIYLKLVNNFEEQKPTILHGVTGSGKSEVFLKCASHIIKQGKQILLLLPEIALTQQMINRITKCFGEEPDVWHSTVTPAQKKRIWHKVQTGKTCFIIGARSSLFLPFKKLGLIIVDEEHDNSFKQEESPIYQGRDLAVLRSYLEKCPIILASATPSIESLHNVGIEKYNYLPMLERFGQASLPSIKIIDMRMPLEKNKQTPWLSNTLIKDISKNLEKSEQSLIFLNRRGFAPLVFCKSCGKKYECPHCSVCLVLHKKKGLLCHHCGFHMAHKNTCSHCGDVDCLITSGSGVEKIKEHIDTLFPDAKTFVFSSDHLNTAKKLAQAHKDICDHQYDIIIGTQMLAKGHHFPNVTLVGILDGDFGSLSSDLRANERAYQLCLQAAGRSGREEKPGTVLIQTHTPEDIAFKSLIDHDFELWKTNEVAARKNAHMPPFNKLIAIILSYRDEEEIENAANYFLSAAPNSEHVEVLGPVDAALSPLKGSFRKRFLLKVHPKFSANSYIKHWLKSANLPSKIGIKVDVDPYSFL